MWSHTALSLSTKQRNIKFLPHYFCDSKLNSVLLSLCILFTFDNEGHGCPTFILSYSTKLLFENSISSNSSLTFISFTHIHSSGEEFLGTK